MGTETEESTQAPPAASKDAKEGAAAATATEESPPVAYTPAASSTVTSFALDSVASAAVEPTALPAADVGRLAADGAPKPLTADGAPEHLPADGAPKPLPADGAPEHLPVESLTDGRMIASIDESSSLEVTVPGAIKAIVKFDLALAQGYLENGNWEALEAYIQKFLKDVQGEKVHMHPGLLCSLYQARVASLVKAGHNATARGIFKDKIEPLVNDLSNPDDILFKPADLEARVKALKNHIENGVPLEKNNEKPEDLMVVMEDYITLHYPESVGLEYTGTIYDLIARSRDELGRDACLACQWILPTKKKPSQIKDHIRCIPKKTRVCPRVTKWLADYLEKIEGGVGSVPVKINTRKRKHRQIEDSDLDDTFAAPVDPAVGILASLFSANLHALSSLIKDRSKAAAKAQGFVLKIGALVDEIKKTFVNCICKDCPLDNEAFSKVKKLSDLTEGIIPLLKYLSPNEHLVIQEELVAKLKSHFTASSRRVQVSESSNPLGVSVSATNGEEKA